MGKLGLASLALLAACLAADPVAAQGNRPPGVTDTEIKVGQTMPYSGPLSAWGTIGKAEAHYIEKVNAEGGVNGRKIDLISLDDGYSPPKTMEQTRRLVEQENVLAIFSPLGTAPNSAIQKYLNAKKVPHLFVLSGAPKWNDPKHFPWTIGLTPSYETEGRIYARYLLQARPNARIAVLYQNDDMGKGYLQGLKEGLGEAAKTMVISEVTYDVNDPVIDSQIITLKSSGADTFFNASAAKYAAQAIRKAYELDWKPIEFVASVSSSIASVLEPAGLERAKGVISASYYKDPTDPQWADDPNFRDWLAWMKKYNPGGDITDAYNVHGYNGAQLLVEVLKRCGNDLSRENVMRTASTLKDVRLPMMIPGIIISTAPDDLRPIKQMKLQRFDGEKWIPFGDVIGG